MKVRRGNVEYMQSQWLIDGIASSQVFEICDCLLLYLESRKMIAKVGHEC